MAMEIRDGVDHRLETESNCSSRIGSTTAPPRGWDRQTVWSNAVLAMPLNRSQVSSQDRAARESGTPGQMAPGRGFGTKSPTFFLGLVALMILVVGGF